MCAVYSCTISRVFPLICLWDYDWLCSFVIFWWNYEFSIQFILSFPILFTLFFNFHRRIPLPLLLAARCLLLADSLRSRLLHSFHTFFSSHDRLNIVCTLHSTSNTHIIFQTSFGFAHNTNKYEKYTNHDRKALKTIKIMDNWIKKKK